jgi:hypothetical protein
MVEADFVIHGARPVRDSNALREPCLTIIPCAASREARPWRGPFQAWQLCLGISPALDVATRTPVRDAAQFLLQQGENGETHFALANPATGAVLFNGRIDAAAKGCV